MVKTNWIYELRTEGLSEINSKLGFEAEGTTEESKET